MTHDFEQRLNAIEQRNARVEFDKAWETSFVRRGFIALTTYIVVGLVLQEIHPEGAWVDAVIPVCGYVLSTLSLPPIKALWIKLQMKTRE